MAHIRINLRYKAITYYQEQPDISLFWVPKRSNLRFPNSRWELTESFMESSRVIYPGNKNGSFPDISFFIARCRWVRNVTEAGMNTLKSNYTSLIYENY